MMNETRIEKDSMGELQVPTAALYGAQTQRAINNFPVSGLTMPRAFIQALGLIKASAAEVNHNLGLLDKTVAQAIITAAMQVAESQHDAHFPIDVFQTGSGTSSNMNCNEVIAHLASTISKQKVHPNDHVNCSQSSNDVIPTAIHVAACLMATNNLLPALSHCAAVTRKKATSVQHVAKTGRTHLMDAMPVTLGQELNAFATQLENSKARVESALQRLCYLAQGGTAVGTGINADPRFGHAFAEAISKKTEFAFKTSPDYFESLATQDAANELSGQLKTVAGSLMKIANDLRWMNSGPLAGISEIALPALQPGSSIMPGKVNPVIPEAVCMVCAQVMGNDVTIGIAASHGNFQLNVMLPVIAYNLLQSIELLGNAAKLLADKAMAGFTVNEANIEARLSRNPILVTALNAVIGYEKGAAIAKKAYAESRPLIDVALEETTLSKAELEKLLDPHALTKGGIPG